MMYDLFAKIFTEKFNKGCLENEIRKIWEKICDKYRPNKWKKEFKKEFLNYIKSILNDYPLFLQFKLLKLYEILEEDLENFTKVLEKRVGRKIYRPEIPSAKEIYKDIILSSPDIKVATPIFSNNSSFLNSLPKYATLIEIIFTLKKPYLSKDDDNFYIIDNPIVKDKVFKPPMVRPTTWKGALRFSAIKVFEESLINGEINEGNWKEKRALLVRLFGNEKDALEDYLNRLIARELKKDKDYVKEEFKKYLIEKGLISKDIPSREGRLFFYPTFFDKISLDVITPLSRETRTPVRGPIYFEIVRENTKGIFRLLYYPFDLIAKGEFDKIEDEIKEDLELLSKALKKMFYEIGFSAKKTSGFGTAEIINVKLQCGDKLKDCEAIKEIFREEFPNMSIIGDGNES